MSSPSSWNLHITGSGHGTDAGKAVFYHSGMNLFSSTRIDDGVWHHISIERYNDETIKMFVDGIINATSTLNLSAEIYSGFNLLI